MNLEGDQLHVILCTVADSEGQILGGQRCKVIFRHNSSEGGGQQGIGGHHTMLEYLSKDS